MLQRVLFYGLGILCLTPLVGPALALLLGLVLAQTTGNPLPQATQQVSKGLLQVSVVGLGFGMNWFSAMESSAQGMGLIVGSIFFTLFLGVALGKMLKVEPVTALLVSVGTAICGGSAIAAVSPILKAKAQQMTVALGIVFLLNALALFLFPHLGTWLHMGEKEFGIWAAIAIHDTSSVVGAAKVYGNAALETAVTLKLTRALWILPLALLLMMYKGKQKLRFPWFILGFVLAMLINTFFPALHDLNAALVIMAKQLLVLTLFLIGAGLDKNSIRSVGLKPFILGICLWVVISVLSLLVIQSEFLR